MGLSNELIKDLNNMEDIMCRTADRCDIWQDRFIYEIAVAIGHILQHIIKEMDK